MTNTHEIFSPSSRNKSPTSPELWTVETELWTGLGRLRHFYVALLVSTLSVSPPTKDISHRNWFRMYVRVALKQWPNESINRIESIIIAAPFTFTTALLASLTMLNCEC